MHYEVCKLQLADFVKGIPMLYVILLLLGNINLFASEETGLLVNQDPEGQQNVTKIIPTVKDGTNFSDQYDRIIDINPSKKIYSESAECTIVSSDIVDSLLKDDKPEVAQSVAIIKTSNVIIEKNDTLSSSPPFFPPPLRRSARELSPETIDWVINNHSLKWKLVTMVRYVGTNNITEERVINLIKENPGQSNPFCDSHQAFLIALASRDDANLKIVSAILEHNPGSINCLSTDRTPLDEATDFRQFEMMTFLRGKGGLTKADLDTISALRPPPLRRQPRVMDSETIRIAITSEDLNYKLITMFRYLGKYDISEDQVINLIRSNPGQSNPYSDSHRAYLIALASREGNINIVSAILEHNKGSINCNNAGLTPLDEAIDFGQFKVARFLREKGGVTIAEQNKRVFLVEQNEIDTDSDTDTEEYSEAADNV